MSDLRRKLVKAIQDETRKDGGYESIENNDYDMHGPARHVFGEVEEFAALSIEVFATWLRERADLAQNVAEVLSEPTARTIALVRVDTIQRLADLISPTHDEGQTP